MQILLTALKNFSDSWHLDPKLLGCRVMFSLVWESKVGFSIRQLIKTHIWFFTCWKHKKKSTSDQILFNNSTEYIKLHLLEMVSLIHQLCSFSWLLQSVYWQLDLLHNPRAVHPKEEEKKKREYKIFYI